MRMQAGLLALEKAVEREILAFFTLLGAGEAPEDWRPQPLAWRNDGDAVSGPSTTRRHTRRELR